MKRQRGRNRNRSNNNNNSNRSLDSTGPDVKVRGSASTIYEKYTSLANDAASSGNRVKAENYRQHAEHYLRLVNTQEAAKQAAREEAEAAKAARGESDSDGEGENRRNRRYPPRVKRSRDNGEAQDTNAQKTEAQKTDTQKADDNKSADKPTPEGLDVVTPEADATANGDTEPKTEAKRRRKAPSRKKSDEASVEAETEAAEASAAE